MDSTRSTCARITLVCQDWGSLLGLRLAAEDPDRFDRIVVANGFLPTADRSPGVAFRAWRAFARCSPVFPIGRIVATGTSGRCRRPSGRRTTRRSRPAATGPGRAPFRCWSRSTRAIRPCRRTERPGSDSVRWEKPFLTLFGTGDPILGRADEPLQAHVPGAHGQPHARVPGGHFVQEDSGVEIARRTVAWMGRG